VLPPGRAAGVVEGAWGSHRRRPKAGRTFSARAPRSFRPAPEGHSAHALAPATACPDGRVPAVPPLPLNFPRSPPDHRRRRRGPPSPPRWRWPPRAASARWRMTHAAGGPSNGPAGVPGAVVAALQLQPTARQAAANDDRYKSPGRWPFASKTRARRSECIRKGWAWSQRFRRELR